MGRVLVIDDDPEIREVLGEALKSVGHEVFLAADGREGLNQCHTTPVDVVITDLFMPNRDGLETIVELRKDFPHTAIIAMSGQTAATPTLAIAMRLGASAILEKPFPPNRLLDTVESLLRSASGLASALPAAS
jgi:DNA-binding response OmpR family regulator